MKPRSTCPESQHLPGLLEGQLPEQQTLDLQEHVETCEACQRTLADLVEGDPSVEKLSQHLGEPRTASETALRAAMAKMSSSSESEATTGEASAGSISLDFLDPSDEPGSQGRLAQYEISEVVGRGGMGIVLKGYDTKLGRVVAIKVLAPELASNATARKRFLREARAAAAVSHDHVVTIYAVDEGRLPYLVMEYIDGQSLQQKIDREGQLELKEILRIGRQVAAGLAAAHAQGLIHRDVKPSNILLQNGIERVQITDFGLARAVDDVGITRSGEVAGTPEYMSPEQADGRPVDHRTDLFSLGSVLYAMCTGRSPFRAESTMRAMRRVCEDRARPIRQVNAEIPPWLAELVERLLDKDPDDRFQTADEVEGLLSGYLAYVQDPSGTTHPRPAFAEKRWRRKRAWLIVAATLAALVASLGLAEATGVTQFSGTVIRLVQGEGTLVIEVDDPSVKVSLDGEELSITGAGVQELKLRPGQYQFQATKDGEQVEQKWVSITRGGRAVVTVKLERGRPTPSESRTIGQTPKPAEQAERQTALEALRRRVEASSATDPFDSEVIELRQALIAFRRENYAAPEAIEAASLMALLPWPVDALRRADIRPSELVAAGQGDASRAPPELVAVLGDSRMKHWCNTNVVAFAPDGQTVLSASWNGTVRQWSVATGEAVAPVEIAGHYSTWVAFSPDRSRLATATGTEVALRDRQSRRVRQLPNVHRDRIQGLAFSHDGTLIATAGSDGVVSLIDFAAAEVVQRFRGHTAPVYCVAFSPSNESVASCGDDGTVRLWSLDGKQQSSLLGHQGRKHAVTFSTAGDKIAAESDDGVVEIWDAASGQRLHKMQAESGKLWVMAVEFAPDGKTLAASGKKSVNIWHVETGSLRQRLKPVRNTASLDFSPDGSKLAGSIGEDVVVWDVKSGTRLHDFGSAHNPPVTSIAVAASGEQVAAATLEFSTNKGIVRLWDLRSREITRVIHEQAEEGWGLNSVVYLAGGHGLAMAQRTGHVTFWNAAADQVRRTPTTGAPGQVFTLAVSPVGSVVAARHGNHVELWDTRSLALQQRLMAGRGARGVAFTPDGAQLVAGCEEGLIKVWSVATGALLQTLSGHTGPVMSVAVSPDGSTLASVAWDQTVRLWDMHSGRLRFSLPHHLTVGSPDGWGQFASVAFSPDGTLLASAAYDGAIRLWNPREGAEQKAIKICPPHGLINQVVFTPDGRHLVTANGNGTVYVLRVAPFPK